MKTNLVSNEVIWERLRSASLGRLITTDATGAIEVFPVSYRVIGREIVFWTRLGGKLRNLATHPAVVFEVDSVDDREQLAWSAVLHATARVETSPAVRDRVRRTHFRPLVRVEADALVVLKPTGVSARQYELA